MIQIKGLSVEVLELDKDSLDRKEENRLIIAQDVELGVVYIAVADVSVSQIDLSDDRQSDNDGIQRIFALSLLDWAQFNAGLQGQIKEQLLERMGLPPETSPEEATRTLLDGMGAGD